MKWIKASFPQTAGKQQDSTCGCETLRESKVQACPLTSSSYLLNKTAGEQWCPKQLLAVSVTLKFSPAGRDDRWCDCVSRWISDASVFVHLDVFQLSICVFYTFPCLYFILVSSASSCNLFYESFLREQTAESRYCRKKISKTHRAQQLSTTTDPNYHVQCHSDGEKLISSSSSGYAAGG